MVNLHKAIKTKKPHIVLPLIKQYDFKGFYFLEGEYILPLLLTYGHFEALEYLLQDKNINIDYKDIYGNTLLYHAIRNGNEEWTQKLINYGANINVKNNNGLTVISEAIMGKKYGIISLMINNGYHMESIDIELIIKGNHIELINYIDGYILDKDLLFFSAYKKNTVILMKSLKRDLSLLLIKNKGVRLFDYIQKHNNEAYVEIVALLLSIQFYIYVAINAKILSLKIENIKMDNRKAA